MGKYYIWHSCQRSARVIFILDTIVEAVGSGESDNLDIHDDDSNDRKVLYSSESPIYGVLNLRLSSSCYPRL